MITRLHLFFDPSLRGFLRSCSYFLGFTCSHLAIQELGKDLDQSSKLQSRRSKMMFLGKKMGTKLDEKRRVVLEKLQQKRAEGTEGLSQTGQ